MYKKVQLALTLSMLVHYYFLFPMWTFWVFSTRIIACLLGDEPPTRGKVGDLNCYPLYLTFSQPSDSLPFAPLADEVIYGRRLKRSRVDVMDISTSFILNGMSESLRNE